MSVLTPQLLPLPPRSDDQDLRSFRPGPPRRADVLAISAFLSVLLWLSLVAGAIALMHALT